jgi:hypothetical protein
MPIDIAFSQDPFDQQRLSSSGGYIHVKPNGQPVFRFENRQQYNRYLELNKIRTA